MTSVRWRSAAVLLCAATVLAPARGMAQTMLTLDEAMTRARGTTASARALASSLAEAEARVQEAKAGFWPRVDVGEAVQRGNQPVFVFSSLLSQRRFTVANFAIPALNNPEPVTNTRTSIAITQPVYEGGRTRLAVEAATLGRDRAAAEQEGTGQDLAFASAQAFVRVLQLEAEVRATDASVAAAESDLQRVRARRDAGLVTEADVLSVNVHLADMRQRQITAAGELAVARIQLAEAIGLPLTENIVAIRPAPRPDPRDAEALVRNAVTTHPESRQADIQQRLADNAYRTTRAGFLPNVGLQGGWEFNGSTLGSQQASWVFGAEVQWNLFRGFGDSARQTAARHAEMRAAAERERVARRIEADARAALAHLGAARARDDAGRAALAQARESQRIIRDRYDSGLATVTDVLRAAEAALDAESRATAAEMDVILQTVALDRALGGL